MLNRLFSRKKPEAKEHRTGSDYIEPLKAERLLSTDRRKVLLDLIWEQTSMSKESFLKLYLAPVSRLAELVQQFPASENHHHAYEGGLLDHSLELMLHALRLRQSYLLPQGAPPEDQSHQTEAWSAACAYGGLLHDAGKPAVDLLVELSDGGTWHPWLGAITKPYRFRYISGRDYKLHNSALGLIFVRVLGPEVLSWLCRYKELWSNFLNLMAGNYEMAGAIGEIVAKADRLSTAQNIGANPERVAQAPVDSIQRKLLVGLQYLIKNEFKLNQPGAQAWLTQDSLWLMSKVVSDKLRAYLLSQGFDGVPTKNSVLFDEMQSHGLVETTPDGKAIWQAEIKDGEWVQPFSFLRMKPSLIWANEEPPARFTGTVTPVSGADGADDTDALSVPTSTAPAVSQIAQSVSETRPIVSQPGDESIDDVMNLFSDMSVSKPEIAQIADEKTKEKQKTVNSAPQPTPEADRATDEIPPIKKKPAKTHHKSLDDMEIQSRRQLAEEFFAWLKESIAENKLAINDTNARVHIVESQVFLVTPGIFQRFSLEQTGQADNDSWKKVQKGFEKLKIHKKLPNDLNIWICTVKGPRKGGRDIKGYLIDPDHFSFTAPLMNNPFLTLKQ